LSSGDVRETFTDAFLAKLGMSREESVEERGEGWTREAAVRKHLKVRGRTKDKCDRYFDAADKEGHRSLKGGGKFGEGRLSESNFNVKAFALKRDARIDAAANDLLFWLVEAEAVDRPTAEEALKHKFFSMDLQGK